MGRSARAMVALFALCLAISARAEDKAPNGTAPPPPDAPAAVPNATPAPDQQPSAPPPGAMIDQPLAMLQALDKITARVRRLPIKVGQTAPFGTLQIEVDACRKAPPEDPPESAAFLKITESKAGAPPRVVFDGWMFASSPALSAMDHPVYDIWVVDCASDATASSAPAQ